MSEIPQVQELVMFNGEQAVTDTRVLAATFGKRHKNVLQAYDNLKCPDDFMRLNFQPHDYIDERGNTRRSVTMTEDGFTIASDGLHRAQSHGFQGGSTSPPSTLWPSISPTTNRI